MSDEQNLMPSLPNGANAEHPVPGSDGIEPIDGSPVQEPVVADGGDEPELEPRFPFNIVGLGASAGGIEAYIQLFENLPADTGMAYVVILHLAVDQKSYLREILARHTRMSLLEIENGASPEPNRVYVNLPGNIVSLEGGVFRLESHSKRSLRPIDSFFFSLAREQKTRAIGVVLSGMDGDGALGLRAIKGEGGITMVQSPDSAQFPDMPQTSISGDHVDLICPPREIAAQLGQLSRQTGPDLLVPVSESLEDSENARLFARLLALMRSVSGVDFRLYKPATIRRRIARRMVLHRTNSLAEYVALLQTHATELRDLHEDALINVTHFFRDPEVFESLKATVLPRILKNREPGAQARIWIAGCSTGEEVYSIAICMLEQLTGSAFEPTILIFGTDASEQSIQRARAAVYPDTIAAEVSPDRLRRFFVKTRKGYQVAKRVRDMCIFARQNLCHDPPFSRMDLISCRNVLIYFGPELQRQLIPTFHYALRSDSYLLLGTSETIREFTDLFDVFDRKSKIYVKLGTTSPRVILDVIPQTIAADLMVSRSSRELWSDVELQRAADRIVLARYGPPGVVVNDQLEILQSRGHTSPFLEMRPGAVTLKLPRMTRENIGADITAAVKRSIEHDVPVQVPGLTVKDGEATYFAMLEVLPIHSLSQRAKCYLVLFVPTRPQYSTFPAEIQADEEPGASSVQMRHDLSSTRLYLQSLLEERDAKNQELVSANEEIQSANEELQSTNEELETTKEELQSANEELHTVNDELQTRNAILAQASGDLNNLLNSVNLPVLMLNEELRIRHFTPPAERVMNVRSTDIGRPFGEIRMNLSIDDLTPLFLEVLESLVAREVEVQDRDGHWYLLRVRPCRTAENKIEGLVVALVDIDQLRRSQQELRSARDFAASVIASISLPLAVVDGEFRICSANEAFFELSGSSARELDRRVLPDVAPAIWGPGTRLRLQLEKLRSALAPGNGFQVEERSEGENPRIFCIRGRVLPDGVPRLLVTFEDITAKKEAERQLTFTASALGRSQRELRALAHSLFTSQEDERRRISRELHDDVSQRLARLDMDSDEIERRMEDNPEAAREKLRAIRAGIGALAADVRILSHRLHPSIVEDLGLVPALRALAEDTDRNEEIIATFSARHVPEAIPPEVATVLYRITQEALRNAVKHAGRTHVKVLLRGTDTGVRLEVTDAGNGFEPGEGRGGLGLISMEERAHIIGSTLEISSSPGHGTKIGVDVPLPQNSESGPAGGDATS